MTGGRDAGRPVDLEAAVVVAGEVRFAGVEAHPDADLDAGGPGFAACRARCAVDGGEDRGPGLLESREQRVALGPDDHPTVPIDRLAQRAEVRRR